MGTRQEVAALRQRRARRPGEDGVAHGGRQEGVGAAVEDECRWSRDMPGIGFGKELKLDIQAGIVRGLRRRPRADPLAKFGEDRDGGFEEALPSAYSCIERLLLVRGGECDACAIVLRCVSRVANRSMR